jgi:hypothetical protein
MNLKVPAPSFRKVAGPVRIESNSDGTTKDLHSGLDEHVLVCLRRLYRNANLGDGARPH